MREIPLTHGKVALVDDEDYEELARFKWQAIRTEGSDYARRHADLPGKRWGFEYMHRHIMGVARGVLVDHENRDGLDNRRANLRVATTRQNQQNQGKRAGTTSRYKGVYWNKASRKWQAQIGSGPKDRRGKASNVYLGCYDDEEAAAHAYDGAALASFGPFARLNFGSNLELD